MLVIYNARDGRADEAGCAGDENEIAGGISHAFPSGPRAGGAAVEHRRDCTWSARAATPGRDGANGLRPVCEAADATTMPGLNATGGRRDEPQ